MKLFFATVGTVLLLFTFCAFGVAANPLIGEWRVYRLQSPDGKVIDTPQEYDLRIVYDEHQYVQY